MHHVNVCLACVSALNCPVLTFNCPVLTLFWYWFRTISYDVVNVKQKYLQLHSVLEVHSTSLAVWEVVGQGSCSFPSDLQEVLGLHGPLHWGLRQQAWDGLVAHGADAADLQPLQQTLAVEGVGTGTHSELIPAAESFQAHSARLPTYTKKTEFLSCSFQNNL